MGPRRILRLPKMPPLRLILSHMTDDSRCNGAPPCRRKTVGRCLHRELPSFRGRTGRRPAEELSGLSMRLADSFGEANIGDPVALSARKTGFDIFIFEVSGCSPKPRRVDIL